MTKKSITVLNETFDIAPAPEPVVLPATVPVDIVVTTDTTQDEQDFIKAQKTLSDLIDTSNGALKELLRVAKESENPRAYEVIGQLAKTISDVTKELVHLQKLRREVSGEPVNNKGTKVERQTNIFVGSTQDLMKAILQAENKQVVATVIEDAEVLDATEES